MILFKEKLFNRFIYILLLTLALFCFQINRFRVEPAYLTEKIDALIKPFHQAILLPQHWIWLYHQTINKQQLIEQNKVLLAHNILLEKQLQSAYNENAIYQKTAEVIDTYSNIKSHLHVAYPVIQDTIAASHKVIIDKGFYDDIRVGQAVLSEKAAMGQVIKVFAHTSQVMLLDDVHHVLPVYLNKDHSKQYLLYGRGVGQPLVLKLMNNSNVPVKLGDMIYTSGLDGHYPKFFPVAVVSQVIEHGQQITLHALPIATLFQSPYFIVITDKKNAVLL